MTDSCEVALYLNQLKDIRELCNVQIEATPETAIALTNRKALLFSAKQTLEIDCTHFGNNSIRRHDPTVEGLVRIKLPLG